MKYILVTGGVISGIGKGVIASSIGTILRSCANKVTAIKIDPYLNIDAGTFSPYEHGEVYVLDDGGEVDLDLGNYERFMDVKLGRDNNITTGKIYQSVIEKERRGDYLGKTVQVVPHITDEIQDTVERVACKPDANNDDPDVCIIELGGTIGDIESAPFVEAFRQFQFHVNKEQFFVIHVSLVPEINGEQKTKPTQHSVREMRGLGLSPDLIICRSKLQVTEEVKKKISLFCHVPPDRVLNIPDCKSLYHVPTILYNSGIMNHFKEYLKLTVIPSNKEFSRWKKLATQIEQTSDMVTIALVGKYTKMADSYISVIKALEHACIRCNLKLNLKMVDASHLEKSTFKEDAVCYHDGWKTVCGADGILVPGGFGVRGIEGMINAIEYAREHKKPFLGICLGMQLAAIEFARNVLNWKNANSTEFDSDTPKKVIIEMPEHHTGIMGGTMRLGKRRTVFKHQSKLKLLYNNVDFVEERHRHRYEVNPEFIEDFENGGFKFVGHDVDECRMEMMELNDHPYFVGTQFHPEYLSRPLKASPPFFGLILSSVGQLKTFLNKLPLPTTFSSSSEEDYGNVD